MVLPNTWNQHFKFSRNRSFWNCTKWQILKKLQKWLFGFLRNGTLLVPKIQKYEYFIRFFRNVMRWQVFKKPFSFLRSLGQLWLCPKNPFPDFFVYKLVCFIFRVSLLRFSWWFYRFTWLVIVISYLFLCISNSCLSNDTNEQFSFLW